MRARRVRSLKAFPVLAIFLVACDDETIKPPDLRPLAIRIDGPQVVTAPAQVQFSAFQTWSDGSSRDVTAAAQWTSTNPSVLSISAGRATASAIGEVSLTAQFEPFTSQPRNVFVLPATPEWNGAYTLSVGGGPCDGELPESLRHRRYSAFVQQNALNLNVVAQGVGSERVGSFSGRIINPQVSFVLIQVAPRRFRRALRTEQFPHQIRLAATANERDFAPPRYWRYAYDGTEEPFMERLPNGNRLVVRGQAATTMSPSGFVGTLNGSLVLYEPSRSNILAACTSTSHEFALLRN